MKIAFTICDCSHAVHAAGDADRQTVFVEIDDDKVPQLVREYVKEKLEERHSEMKWCYKSCSLSIVVE